MTSNRIVVLVDMDCFYVQVEQRRDPAYKGKPCAVVQYKKYRGGGIIAVGYEARDHGVTRGMMGDDAKEKCPSIHLFRVPESNGKANLDRYREAGAEVINVLSQFGGRVERASIDEAYIDLTDVTDKILQENNDKEYLAAEKLPRTHVIGYPTSRGDGDGDDKDEIRRKGINEWLSLQNQQRNLSNIRLCIAATLVEEIRAAVYQQTGFRCSAGISHNKMLSKLACGINKPNKQTVLPESSIAELFKTIKIGKIRNLGGKLGKSLMSDFAIEFMSQIVSIEKEKLVKNYGLKTASWLKEVSQGIDHEHVKERHVAQSIGCGKNFFGPDALNTKTKVKKWLDALMIELSARLTKDKESNDRIARTLTVHVKLERGKAYSRSAPLIKYDRGALLEQGLHLIQTFDTISPQNERWYPAIVQLSVNAKKFDNIGPSSSSHNVSSFFKPSQSTPKCNENTRPSSLNCDIGNATDIPQSNSAKILTIGKSIATSKESFLIDEKIEQSVNVTINRDQPASKATTGIRSTKEGFFSKRGISIKNRLMDVLPDVINSAIEQPCDVELDCVETENSHVRKDYFTSKPESTVSGSATLDFRKDSNENDCTSEDVIFVSEFRSNSSTQATPQISNSDKKLCKIDEMFQKDRDKSVNTSQKAWKRPLFHPNFGEIDKSVFNNLPKDIQQEILKSCEITSPTPVRQNVATTSQSSLNSKSSGTGQRLISNFIPQGASNHSLKIAPKRKSTSPMMQNKTKHNKSNRKDTRMLTSKPTTNDVMPLGFFRQRSQLSSAIAKAISNDRHPSIKHIPHP